MESSLRSGTTRMAAEKVKPHHTIARVTKGLLEEHGDQLDGVIKLYDEEDSYRNEQNIKRKDYDSRRKT